ncbi:hypothetical protein [Nocardia sp. NPDC049149]|uniref:hypothetical protein n=1 Tax=Nocardia sp. NPDC049149 TaxID=3364315 RepID=UPI00371940FD
MPGMCWLWLTLISKAEHFDWSSMPSMPWAALLTGGFTLAGGVLGALIGRRNMHSVLVKQFELQHRVEQREPIAVIADTIVELKGNEHFFHAARMLAECETKSGDQYWERLDRFNRELIFASERPNALKRALRRGDLFVDAPELVDQLAPLGPLCGEYGRCVEEARERHEEPQVFEAYVAQATAIHNELLPRAQKLMEIAAKVLKTQDVVGGERESS